MFGVGVTLFEVLTGRHRDPEAAAAALLHATRGEGSAGDSTAAQRELLEGLCLRLMERRP